MGIVYEATLDPSKQELVAAWLPSRTWAGGLEIATKVGEYRFDDPAGEVGVETIVFAATDGSLLQVPLTYRAEPQEDAEHLQSRMDVIRAVKPDRGELGVARTELAADQIGHQPLVPVGPDELGEDVNDRLGRDPAAVGSTRELGRKR